MTQQGEVNAHDKQIKALTLRKAGVSYQSIADTLGYKTAGGAWVAVKAGLKKTLVEPADELRTLEIARLDDYLKAIANHVSAGNLTAIDRALKIQQRRAALLGLDMPAKVDVTSGGENINPYKSLSDSEILDELKKIVNANDKSTTA
jgi:hypothetical protein